MTTRLQRRGFTLIELMVSLAVMAFCITLVMAIFVAQQKSFASQDLMRVAQEAGRDASLDFEVALRRAGWGMDPQYAFDFRTYQCTATPGTCRDHTDGADEIVFYSRNPYYIWDGTDGTNTNPAHDPFKGHAWAASTATTTSVTLTMRPGEVIEQNQVIELTQNDGSNPTMVTAKNRAVGPGAITVQLDNTVTDAYHSTVAAGNALVFAFLIDRFRYFVQTFGGTPYLMFDSGLYKQNNGAGPFVKEIVPVAKNVEDLQIAYVLNTPQANPTGPPPGWPPAAPDSTNKNWIVGDAAGVQEEPNPTVAAPNYTAAGTLDASRYTLNPSNIRLIRYAFTIRSFRPDPGPTASWTGDPFLAQENFDSTKAPAAGRFRRVVVAGSVATRNLESRNPFVF